MGIVENQQIWSFFHESTQNVNDSYKNTILIVENCLFQE
jgi:hypothetical protein